jgi:hypothetical protein
MINTISNDATQGGIIITQTDETSPFAILTNGVMMPLYCGTGAPTPTTLAGLASTSPYYRLYSRWLDITTPTAPIEWICTTAGDKTSSVWAQITSGAATRYRFKDDLGSSLRCRSWDGTTEGSVDIFIAKRPELWTNIASDVQNGVTYTYSYAAGAADTNGNHYWKRTTTGSDGSGDTDDITPPYLFNKEIFAMGIAAMSLDGNSCTLMDTSGREWGAEV